MSLVYPIITDFNEEDRDMKLEAKEVLKVIKYAIYVVSIVCLTISKVYAQEIEIPSGTPVTLRFLQTISSEEAAVGQAVGFSVARDVVVNGKTVIKSGAPGQGSIVRVEKKGAIGEAGEILISARSVMAVDGTEVPLRDTMSIKGKEKVGGTVALGVIVCPLFLLRKGEEAQIAGGSELRAYVDYPVKIKIQE